MILKDIGLGFATFFQAITFIKKNKLRYFYLFPLVLSIILFWISSEFKDVLIDVMKEFIYGRLGLEKVIDNEGWLSGIVSGSIYWIITITAWFLWFKLNRYVVLIVLSPVFSILSEKVESTLTGKEYPFDIRQVFKDVIRGVVIATKNIFVELLIVLLGIIIPWVFPPASIVTVPVVLLTAWYFMGFSFIDYNYERRKIGVWDGSKEMWRRKGLAFSNGFLFTMMNYIPILGVVFGSIWSTVGASLAINKSEQTGFKTR